jgi:hypothetical protein
MSREMGPFTFTKGILEIHGQEYPIDSMSISYDRQLERISGDIHGPQGLSCSFTYSTRVSITSKKKEGPWIQDV